MLTIHETEETVMTHLTPPSTADLPAIRVVDGPTLKSGTPIVTGFMPAGVLIPDRYEIPYFDPRTKKGYQRKPQDARINQLAHDLRKDRVDLPTAVLLNIRNKEARDAVRDGTLEIEFLLSSTALTSKFYVVDGQHRVLALDKLMKENQQAWFAFMIPFVCMLGATEEEEMRQFHIVNSTAKSVRTDLALQLLRKRADKEAGVIETLQERGREWQLSGERLIERLGSESAIWQHRIRFANMEKGNTTISSASMVTSLKPLLESPNFASLKQDSQLKILEAYWVGIREVLRPVFDEPTEHALQKGVGAGAMHTILPYVLEIVKNKGWSVVESDSYARILWEPLEKLEGDNHDGNPVSGPDFWAVAPKGAAGTYSGSAGRRVLVAKIRQQLPEVEAE